MIDADLRTWLLDPDPALRWQVERDLLDAPEHVWLATRARIATEGRGARFLSLQDEDGRWAGGSFFPGGFLDDPANQQLPGQPWTATTWTLTTMREDGMDAAPLIANDTAGKLERNARWEYDGLPYWDGEVDCCINAMTLANGLWLGRDMEANAAWFVEHQMRDGGWNCEWVEGSTRGSFHSTLNALKGLLDHEIATRGTPATRLARRRGEEYLLSRGLMRRASTHEVVGSFIPWFGYPFRHIASALNSADHMRRVSLHDGTPPDPRMREAIEMIRESRESDGTWHQGRVLPGEVWFPLDVPEGEPSPWVTMIALRVLRWYDEGTGASGPASLPFS